jgi:uncharacterized glyoxalase superfamily protein PhnB
MPKVKPIPKGYGTVTPGLAIQGASDFIKFCKKVFGAKEITVMKGPGNSIMHAELQIGTSRIMLGEEMPSFGTISAKTIGGSPVTLNVYVENCDAVFAKALKAGATAVMPPADMFWGDRYARLTDPFGNHWSVATHIEDVSPAEMRKRGKAFAKQMEAAAAGGSQG